MVLHSTWTECKYFLYSYQFLLILLKTINEKEGYLNIAIFEPNLNI